MLSEIGMCNTNTNMLPNQVWETAKDTVRFDEAYATLHSVLGFFGEGLAPTQMGRWSREDSTRPWC